MIEIEEKDAKAIVDFLRLFAEIAPSKKVASSIAAHALRVANTVESKLKEEGA